MRKTVVFLLCVMVVGLFMTNIADANQNEGYVLRLKTVGEGSPYDQPNQRVDIWIGQAPDSIPDIEPNYRIRFLATDSESQRATKLALLDTITTAMIAQRRVSLQPFMCGGGPPCNLTSVYIYPLSGGPDPEEPVLEEGIGFQQEQEK